MTLLVFGRVGSIQKRLQHIYAVSASWMHPGNYEQTSLGKSLTKSTKWTSLQLRTAIIFPDLRGVESVESVDTSRSPTLPSAKAVPVPLMSDDRGERWRKRGEIAEEKAFFVG